MANNEIDFQAIRADNPIADTINRYIELRKRGSEYVACCPFHNDKNPSFYVVPKKHKAFCMACGWHGDVVDFVAEFDSVDTAEAARRLSGGELPTDRPALPDLPPDEADDWLPVMPAPTGAPAYDPARTYNPRRGREVNWKRALTRCDAYRAADGRVLGYVVRMEIDGQKLTPTVTWARHRDGRECWASVKFPNPRPLQGLDDLAARPEAAVLVVSGEKCREAGASALPGFVTVTWPGGDQNVLRADWTPLHGRRVTIWPDADDSGRDACQRLAEALHGHVAELRMIDTAGLPAGWDIADGVADGMDTAALVAWARDRVAAWSPAEPTGPTPETKTAPLVRDGAEAVTEKEGNGQDGQNRDTGDAPSATLDRPARSVPMIEVLPPVDSPVVKTEERLSELESTVDAAIEDVPAMYSEDNVALLFSGKFADDLRYVAPWGKWLQWDGARWAYEDTLKVFDMVRATARAVGHQAMFDTSITPKQQESVRKQCGQAAFVAAVERMARADRRHAATVGQWDADEWALNTPAGVVDLRTGQVHAGKRSAHMTKITNVAPASCAPIEWLAFLDTATGGDQELVRFLQRMCGYALTGSTREHALFFVYGSGGNGKGTFLNTFQWIIGDYAKASPADMFTERKNEAHTTELARLMGARLVTAQETEEGKRWAEAKIKALTGGDTITARFMRQDDFEFVPQFKLVMTGNHKPGLRNVDEAIKRRLHLIPFTINIPAERRDKSLPERLRSEAGAILSWAIEGCLEWQRIGLSPPSAVVAATDEYLEQQDVLGLWLAECCEEVAGFSAKRSDLYKSFKTWAESAGEYVLPQKRWVAAMEMRGFEARMLHGIAHVAGLRIKREVDQW